jgi:hypothetical protein
MVWDLSIVFSEKISTARAKATPIGVANDLESETFDIGKHTLCFFQFVLSQFNIHSGAGL